MGPPRIGPHAAPRARTEASAAPQMAHGQDLIAKRECGPAPRPPAAGGRASARFRRRRATEDTAPQSATVAMNAMNVCTPPHRCVHGAAAAPPRRAHREGVPRDLPHKELARLGIGRRRGAGGPGRRHEPQVKRPLHEAAVAPRPAAHEREHVREHKRVVRRRGAPRPRARSAAPRPLRGPCARWGRGAARRGGGCTRTSGSAAHPREASRKRAHAYLRALRSTPPRRTLHTRNAHRSECECAPHAHVQDHKRPPPRHGHGRARGRTDHLVRQSLERKARCRLQWTRSRVRAYRGPGAASAPRPLTAPRNSVAHHITSTITAFNSGPYCAGARGCAARRVCTSVPRRRHSELSGRTMIPRSTLSSCERNMPASSESNSAASSCRTRVGPAAAGPALLALDGVRDMTSSGT